jgi:protein TonB
LAQAYPNNALRDHVGGNAQLDCVVRGDYGVTCFVASETPANQGFGRAALSIVSSYRSRATLSDGSSAAGAHTRISLSFRPPATGD